MFLSYHLDCVAGQQVHWVGVISDGFQARRHGFWPLSLQAWVKIEFSEVFMSLAMMHFDNRLFQRGLTWSECMASWRPSRSSFLQDVEDAPGLPNLKDLLLRLDSGRFVILYSPYSLDCRRSLPILGPLFGNMGNLNVRFFAMEHFFPLLYPVFGRPVPRVCLLDESGKPCSTWGPRAKTVQAGLAERAHLPAPERDAWLWSIDTDLYAGALDNALRETFHDAVHEQISDSPTVPN